jgi:mRNA interferase HigB
MRADGYRAFSHAKTQSIRRVRVCLEKLARVPNWDYHERMHIVSRAILTAFYSQPRYADSRDAIEAWFEVATKAQWRSPADVKAAFGSASIVGNNRVVFNIKGNDYRLIVAIAYKMQWAYVKFVGTHKQYDAIDAATVDNSK